MKLGPRCEVRISQHAQISKTVFSVLHQATHSEERPFKCRTCGLRFKLRHNLKKHEESHNDERPFKCELCDKCFKRNDHLSTHMKFHNGEKMYGCKTCNKKFVTSYRKDVFHIFKSQPLPLVDS